MVREIEAADVMVLARRCMDVAELLALPPATAEVAIVDVDLPGLDVDAVATLEQRGVRVVAVGDPARASSLGIGLSAGPGEVEAVVSSSEPSVVAASVSPELGEAGSPGRVTAVWGPHGAPGRSTVALATAAELSRSGQPVVLVDADTYGGSQAQQVALLDDVSGLMAACRSANRGVLGEAVEHVVPVADHLGLLTGIPRPDMWTSLRPAALERVLAELRDGHAHVVVDCGFSLEEQDPSGQGRNRATLQVLRDADLVVAVGRADPVGLARLVRGLHDLRDLVDAEPHVVLNRVRPTLGWDERELAATVDRLADARPVAFLPEDADALDAAVMAGELVHVAAPHSPFVARVTRLVATLTQICDRDVATVP